MDDTILVTGATGNLGALVIQNLLERGVDPAGVVGLARDPEDAATLAEAGVEIRAGDYEAPDSLDAALQDIDRVLLVSSSEVGQRVEQHGNVIDAAEAAGVDQFVYTSALRADTSTLPIATEHVETESLLAASDLSYTLLRNGWYLENYTGEIDQIIEEGAVVGAAGEGRISAAARQDYAEAAATVLLEDSHGGEIYELGGDSTFTLAELAEEISAQSGHPVEYRDLPEDEYATYLAESGMPEPVADMFAATDREISNGELYTESDDLQQLIGRPTTTLASAVTTALEER